MATEAEFDYLKTKIFDGGLVTSNLWISTTSTLAKVKSGKGKATKENIQSANRDAPELAVIASSFADTHDKQHDVAFGILIAIPDFVNRGDVDNYAAAICDLMVELFKQAGSFDGDSSKTWDDGQIKDM